MIVSGIAATPAAALDGHVLLAGAVDVAQLVPLCIEHAREIGQVVHMFYLGASLHVQVETADDDALGLGFFSVAGKPVERTRDGDLWRVTKFSLTEVSLVRRPVNPHCVVVERTAHDPLREFTKTRLREFDLAAQAFGLLARGLAVACHA